ncbi:hypothetical protein SESBI_44183 [Sesbania bispinosa]|nr:hypothetical protein SESBI_44183 [Sesbania bispinosa]
MEDDTDFEFQINEALDNYFNNEGNLIFYNGGTNLLDDKDAYQGCVGVIRDQEFLVPDSVRERNYVVLNGDFVEPHMQQVDGMQFDYNVAHMTSGNGPDGGAEPNAIQQLNNTGGPSVEERLDSSLGPVMTPIVRVPDPIVDDASRFANSSEPSLIGNAQQPRFVECNVEHWASVNGSFDGAEPNVIQQPNNTSGLSVEERLDSSLGPCSSASIRWCGRTYLGFRFVSNAETLLPVVEVHGDKSHGDQPALLENSAEEFSDILSHDTLCEVPIGLAEELKVVAVNRLMHQAKTIRGGATKRRGRPKKNFVNP